MVKLSLFNNTLAPLPIDGFFLGAIESTQEEVSISVNVLADVPVRVIIRQYRSSDVKTLVQENFKDVAADVKEVVQTPVKAQFFNVAVLNESGGSAATITQATTYLQASHYVNLDVRQLSATEKQDSVVCYGVDLETGLKHPLNVNADGSLIVIGGGGGDASQWATFPAVADVDMDFNGLLNVNGISGEATKGLDMSADGILSLTSNNSGVVLSSKTEIVLAIQPESSPTPLPTKTLTYDVNGDLTFAEGTQNITNELGTTTSKGFVVKDGGGGTLNMNGNVMENVGDINGKVGMGLVLSGDIAVELGATNGSIALHTYGMGGENNLEYSQLGNFTLYGGEQNITNSIGVTTSKEFTLTQGGGGVITFEDGTTMATAGGGGTPTTWSEYPATQAVDMGGFGLTNINGDITTGVNGSLTLRSNNNDPVASASLRLIINEEIDLNTKPSSEIKLEGAELTIKTAPNGWDNIPINTFTFGGDGKLAVPSLQLLSGSLDLNGEAIVGTQQIFGDNDMIFTAGLTNTSETSTLSLTNNGYAVAGTYSQLFLKPTGVELNTGDITAETDYKATFDIGGTLTVPSLALEVGGFGIQMNGSTIRDAKDIIGADNEIVTIQSDIAVNLIADSNGTTPKTASLDTTGVFNAKSFTLYQGQGGEIKFPNNTTQTTAYQNNDIRDITSTDGSITINFPDANTANLAVTSPYSLPVATTTVLGGVKPDGTTITATVDGVISATSQGITSNTFYVNDNVNTINDVLPLMGSGDICIVSAGSFGNTVDINWNVAQTGLSGSVAPLPLTFLTTANASRFTVSAVQVRIANIKFQMPVFLSNNNLTVDNCDFDDNLTVGTNVSGYITINNCEFVGTKTVTVASTFGNVCYFINCNFLGSTFVLSQASASQVVFNNCAGFTTYPANATYVGINVLSAGTAQMNADTIKSVVAGGNVKYASQINMDGNNIINVNNISGRTGDPPSFTQSFEVATGAGNIQMRGNGIITCGSITQLIQGSTLNTLSSSTAGSRNLFTVTVPPFVSGASATFVMNDLGTLSLKNVTLTTGGIVTFPDATTQNTAYKNLDVQTITNTDGMLTITAPTTHGVTIQSAMKKGTATLGTNGAYDILDNTVTASCVCVVTYADDSPTGGVLCAKVQAGYGITIQSALLADRSPFFYMYFI